VRHASLRDLTAIYRHFQAQRDVFPHIRQDGLKRRVGAHQCIYQDGVIVMYQRYRKRTRVGNVQIPARSIMLHQILNSRQFSGKGGEVLEQFVREIVKPAGGDLYVTVGNENAVARRFYERNGMKIVGTVAWKNRTIPGLVYRRSLQTKTPIERPFSD